MSNPDRSQIPADFDQYAAGFASADGGDYIRSNYRVPAELDGRITFEHEHRDGTIVRFDGEGAYLWVLLDGDDEPVKLHPTWEVTYHATKEAAK